jgi:DNA polymerase (family 10)
MLDKFEIASALREISLLLELKQENPYKTRAYSVGAAALEAVNEDIGAVIEDGRLTTIRGIGDTLAGQIVELYKTGSSSMLDRLREELPPGVIELSQVPGLSVKKIQALHEELGISSIPELEAACKAGRVATVKGFGKKTQANILEGIRLYETREQVEILLNARETCAHLLQHLRGKKRIHDVEIAGSIRRWQETVRNINVVIAAADRDYAIETLEEFPLVTRAERPGDDRSIARLASGMRVYCRVVPDEEFQGALLWDTGSREHVEALKELAHQRGYALTPKGLTKNSRLVKAATEADIYKHLGLPFMPPEVRESVDDITAALNGAKFDDLIDVDDIQGMTHCHTVYSDGKATVEQMVRAAEQLGMKYITITDHSPAAHYAGGLELDRLKRQWDEIEEVQEKIPQVRIFRGTESDILEDGSLDYPDSILDQFDVIIASVHSRMKMDREQMTRRVVNCMRKRQFKVWGHALGRLLLRREPFQCDVEEVLDAIAESRAAIEVNGDPYRLDMEPKWIREARKRNIPFIISVDAHSTGALNYIRYGVHIARRGGLRKREILNTLAPAEFARRVKPA